MDMLIILALEGFLFKWISQRYNGGHPLKPLPKIAAGLFSCTLSCICCGILQACLLFQLTFTRIALSPFNQVFMDDAEDGALSLAWQLPQYFFISVAEILVCIPALEFAYEDSPVHLRSIVTSLWYISQVCTSTPGCLGQSTCNHHRRWATCLMWYCFLASILSRLGSCLKYSRPSCWLRRLCSYSSFAATAMASIWSRRASQRQRLRPMPIPRRALYRPRLYTSRLPLLLCANAGVYRAACLCFVDMKK